MNEKDVTSRVIKTICEKNESHENSAYGGGEGGVGNNQGCG